MHAAIVTFSLKPTMGAAEYLAGREARAPKYLEVPGFVAKIWIGNEEENRFGAVYLFESRQAVEDFLAGDVFAGVRENPHYADLSMEVFEVGEGPSRITNGWIERASASRQAGTGGGTGSS